MNRSRDLDPVPDMHAAAEDRTPPLCLINKRHVCAFCCPTQSVSASYMVLFVELHLNWSRDLEGAHGPVNALDLQ